MSIKRRPYHKGSQSGPAPSQDVSIEQQIRWVERIGAYWPRSNAKARQVADSLVSFMGIDGALYPTMESIAKRADCEPRTVQRWLDSFKEVGFLQVIQRRNLFGQTANAYVLLFPETVADRQPPREQSSSSKLSSHKEGKKAKENQNLGFIDSLELPARSGPRLNPQPPVRTPAEQIAELARQEAVRSGNVGGISQMIHPTSADLGRRVIYRDLPGGKIEEGVLTGFNHKFAFVLYGDDGTPAATRFDSLAWSNRQPDETATAIAMTMQNKVVHLEFCRPPNRAAWLPD
jgi:hypothetical protein